jgi:hypothetical protein
MYAFTPDQPLCLVYEDFYLAIVNTFYEFIKDNIMKEIWIIGAGFFGSLALDRLDNGKYKFVIIDADPDNIEKLKGRNRTVICEEGVEFLEKNLRENNKPDWIIPALPVHLAAEWCLLKLGPEKIFRIGMPDKIEDRVPNPSRGSLSEIYVSHATFICPDNCPEPKDICTHTGKKRKNSLYEILEKLKIPDRKSLVVRSLQLGNGVGGYRPEQLFDLLEQVKKSTKKLLISTACRCHGVISSVAKN